MTLGPLMLDIGATALSPADRSLLQHPAVGGVILFARNYQSPAQLEALCTEIRALRTPELLIAVDQEGGRVQRFQDGLTRLPPMRQLGRVYDADPKGACELARRTGWLLGAELAAVGIDFSFAPVLDLDWGVSEVIGDRALHADPDCVAELGVALMRGLGRAGLVAIAKHFPGHGAVVADSHEELPTDRREFSELSDDIKPFQRLIRDGLAGIMTAHVVYSSCDPLPATLSRWWLASYLRGELGFDGAIFSDDLSMRAVREFGTLTECARMSLQAGCDIVLVCNDRRGAERVAEALASWQHPPSMVRRVSLRKKTAPGLADLRADPAWREACRMVDELSRPPDFSLDA